MDYHFTVLKKMFSISKIVTVHYFEYTKNYLYIGEKHNFWEFVYVDKGSVDIQREKQWFSIKQGEMIFHQPGEYHNLRANGVVAPNLVVVAFHCNSPAMTFFNQKKVKLSDSEKHLLANIITEAKSSFESPLNDPTLKKMERRSDSSFGSEQMISLLLESLLISVTRNYGITSSNTTTFQRNTEDAVIQNIIQFMQDNIQEKLVFQDVVNYVGMSASGLKNIFKRKMGVGVMNYFTKMKMEAAKKMIREDDLNITQISAKLGFDSIHLFSRRFRQMNGMSPTEYAKSVKVEFDIS